MINRVNGHYQSHGEHVLPLQVKTDEFGRMKVDDLKRLLMKARSDGKLPFFVNATAGTTVLGAIDPLPEIAAICRNESLWLHVDVRIKMKARLARGSDIIWTGAFIAGLSRRNLAVLGEVPVQAAGHRIVRNYFSSVICCERKAATFRSRRLRNHRFD